MDNLEKLTTWGTLLKVNSGMSDEFVVILYFDFKFNIKTKSK
jgi:hypothetical protein